MARPFPQGEYNAGQPTSGYPGHGAFGGPAVGPPFGGPPFGGAGQPAGGPFSSRGGGQGPAGGPSRPTPPATGGGSRFALGGTPAPQLLVALVVAGAALVLALLFGQVLAVAWVSWVSAGPVAVGLLAWYSRLDTIERTRPLHVPVRWRAPVYWTAVVVAAAGIGVSAYHIADWAARL